ncbi:MAG TPA: gfo/Idh/MocA family oxidoreductase [Clostridiales bacterium]|nr:gfo/Idh/MocA family oxidoreductase [Clostridiales bacterium]
MQAERVQTVKTEFPRNADDPLRVAVVGAGSRAMNYSAFALREPSLMKVVAVAEPDEYRRVKAAQEHSIPETCCFASVQEMMARHPDFDAVINGTMDADHVPTSLPILQAGYNLLLEKPISLNKKDLFQLYDAARQYGNKVMICHVLRYAPFYVEIKKRILAGDIGEVISLQTEENVSYHHLAAAYIRGKWNNSDVCGSKILMAKCCHDLDILTWLKSGIAPRYISSFGGLKQFRAERAPAGSGQRCLADCQIESNCPYSARKHYLDSGLWPKYAWRSIEQLEDKDSEVVKTKSLCSDNPFGRCVWHCDNNVEDHQCVMIEFEDGTTAVHTLNGGTAKPCRVIHVIGTRGEIYGITEDQCLMVRHPDPRKGHEFSEEKVLIPEAAEEHGGGDCRLVADFVRTMKGQQPSVSCTELADSIYGHLIGFAAEEAMRDRKVVEISKI